MSDLFSTILAKIQILMLQQDIERMQTDPNFSLDASDGVYIVFLIIGIVGYFTIPTVAGWIIQAGGGIGSYNKNIGTAGALGGSVAGAAAGNVAGRAGKLIKGTAGKVFSPKCHFGKRIPKHDFTNRKRKTKRKMEFKSLKNIETSFRQIRLFGIVYTAACALVVVCSVVCAFRFAEAQRQKIYVLDGGKSLMLALSQDLSQNRPAEAREHVRRLR